MGGGGGGLLFGCEGEESLAHGLCAGPLITFYLLCGLHHVFSRSAEQPDGFKGRSVGLPASFGDSA